MNEKEPFWQSTRSKVMIATVIVNALFPMLAPHLPEGSDPETIQASLITATAAVIAWIIGRTFRNTES